MKAGFDLSEISLTAWKALLEQHNLSSRPVKTDEGWIWMAHDGSGNIVVTANDPVSGKYYHDRYGIDAPVTGYLGYVGIEGDAAFVAQFFVDFKLIAEYYKGEEFGKRSFI